MHRYADILHLQYTKNMLIPSSLCALIMTTQFSAMHIEDTRLQCP